MNSSIRCWAEDDRPREKLILKGAHTLSDAEILAILIGSGTRKLSAVDLARMMLSSADNDLNALAGMNEERLSDFPGIGSAKSSVLLAAFELSKRRQFSNGEKLRVIQSSKDAFNEVRIHFQDMSHEEFHVLFLSRSNQVLKHEVISKGGLNNTIADGKIIFRKALERKASALILIHNHPSGRLIPSDADKRLTKKLSEFSKLIDLQILDHLIVSADTYFSFADEGLMQH
jgi:DNA repair protein RadC